MRCRAVSPLVLRRFFSLAGLGLWLSAPPACTPSQPSGETSPDLPRGSGGTGGSSAGAGQSGGGSGTAGSPGTETGGIGASAGGAPGIDAATGAGGAGAADAPPASGMPTPAGWWDAKWTKRSQITVSDAALTEELTDFQIPVRLTAASIDWKAARPDGADLRFVGQDGSVLAHEIESWDAAGSTALVWLRLPHLGKTAIVVSLYHGNPGATPLDDAASKAVWPVPYAGVWHLGGNAKDATASGFDGAAMVGGAFAEGQFGKGFTLVGAMRDHIQLKSDIKILAGAAGCTFSAWIKPTKIEAGVNGMIIMTLGKWFNNNHNSYADFNVNASGQMISHIDPGTNMAASGYARILSDPGFIKADEWAWVTYVIDLASDEERFFKNGMLISTKKPPNGKFSAAAFIDMVSTRVVIGAEEDVVSHWYTGTMDELRIEKGLRPPAWIAAQYRAMTSAGFVTVVADK